jgi:hypothetical protein
VTKSDTPGPETRRKPADLLQCPEFQLALFMASGVKPNPVYQNTAPVFFVTEWLRVESTPVPSPIRLSSIRLSKSPRFRDAHCLAVVSSPSPAFNHQRSTINNFSGFAIRIHLEPSTSATFSTAPICNEFAVREHIDRKNENDEYCSFVLLGFFRG